MSAIQCQRSGCSGAIIDGICEDCGRAPAGKSLLDLMPPSASAVSSSTPGTVTTRSALQATSASAVTGRTGSRRQSSRSSRSSSARRQSLGGGLISLPLQASQDPLKLLMSNPEVPERKRRCPGCDNKVNRVKGFCPGCGVEYNFAPSLVAGDLVNGKFEVKGAIAFGGLGWIYLGWDTTLARWVVLKGLLNAKDEASAAAAVAERQFLAAVKHPKIVGIYDFINHAGEGFIVMEYVGGRTIDSLLKERGTLPVEEAIAYILGILPAFSYLHANGFVYCDFKPDNFMLENDDVKLIDMGGVRRIGDPDGDIFGTKGYMAPEGADDPEAVSDLYTVGRTLANLVMNFKYQSSYEFSLPTPTEQPVLAEHESLYRFLLRATHIDPDQRFQSADEMADQLYGVLREIVALKGGPKPAESKVFTADNLLDADDAEGAAAPLLRLLPTIKVDAADAAANELLRLASVIDVKKRISALHQLSGKMRQSAEARLRYADALIANGDMVAAKPILDQLEQEDAFDWRVKWYRGKAAMAAGAYADARIAFDKVYFEMPGEAAPKLALAYAAELQGDSKTASSFYRRVARLDPAHTSACFGLARSLIREGDVAQASAALGAVSPGHSLYMQARIVRARLLLDAQALDERMLDEAAESIETIAVEGSIVHQLAATLFSSALELIARGKAKESMQRKLLGQPMAVASLRLAAEAAYRQAGRYAQTLDEKMHWVNQANAIRPRTLI